MPKNHRPDCNWQKTKPEECEYRNTHHYCPHEEHQCNCEELRIAGLQFHIESQDYFGTLAAVLSLSIQTKQPIPEGLISDLMYLQENYKIERK